MMYRALTSVPALIVLVLVLVSPAAAVTITFETRPDGTPIQNLLGCSEIAFDTFRPWGVLLNPPEGDTLDIRTTVGECLSTPNALGLCSQIGTIIITFVVPGTNISTTVDGIDMALFTGTMLPWQGEVRVYDGQGMLLDLWALTSAGFCREPPFYYDFYHFSAPGRIARVECFLRRVGIDDLIVTEASTPAEGSTWGAIKSTFK
jgi:hypothetical protein